ncbi:MAG: translation initiation factor IF-3 [Patescibacteria group bacterium]|nr:translation initiation factor IF-3 [Patescibacteria group bacterium]
MGSDGKQIGILGKDEALFRARELEVDLVEVAANANPPVCRLIDFKKFKYQEAKREREAKKNTKTSQTKEIRLSPFIAQHDWEIQVEKGKEFLKDGNKLRVAVKFAGRQLGKTEFGKTLLNKTFEALKTEGKIEREAKMEGRQMVLVLSPI